MTEQDALNAADRSMGDDRVARELEPKANGGKTALDKDSRHHIRIRVPVPKGRGLVVIVYLDIRDHSTAE